MFPVRLNRFLRFSVVGLVALLRLTLSFSTAPVVLATGSAVLVTAPLGAAPAEAKRSFDLPRGDAATTLRQFAAASGRSLVYVTDKVRGETTKPVRGEFTPREALERMLADTALEAVQDSATGALIVSRRRSAGGEPGTGASSSVSQQQTQSKTMTSKPRTLLAAVAGWLALGTDVSAQTVAPTPPAQEEAVVLSPFEVSATSDVGYQARETLAGGRLRTELRNVSSQVDVMTQEFISDLGINTLEESFKYSLSVESENDFYNPQGSSGTLTGNPFDPNGSSRARGVGRASTTIGFFETSAPVDTFNTERFSFVGGPNAILFGNGLPGGSVDSVFKRASLTQNKYSATLQVDSDEGYRASVDLSQVLIKNRLGARFATMTQDQDYGRTPSYDRQERMFGSLNFEPHKMIRMKAWYDYGLIERSPVRATLVQDKVTPYLDALEAKSPGAKARFLSTYDSKELLPYSFDNSALNSVNAGANNNATDAALTAQGFRTLTNNLPNTQVASRLSADQPVLISGGSGTGIPVTTWHNTAWTQNGPGPYFGENTDWSFSDNSLFPSEINMIGNGLQNVSRHHIYGGTFEFNPVRNLYLEYGYNHEEVNFSYTELLSQGNAELLIDVNRYLPAHWAAGAPVPTRVTNPNFGRYYVQGGNVAAGDNQNEREDHRVTLTYQLDFTKNKGWSRWLGVHNMLGLWTRQMNQRFEQVRTGGSGATVISDNLFTAQNDGSQIPAAVSVQDNRRRLQVRHYLGSPTAGTGGLPAMDVKFDPWNWGNVGVDAAGRPVTVAGEDLPWGSAWSISNGRKESEGIMGSIQSAFLDGRVIANYGRRSDDNNYTSWLPANLQYRYDAGTGQYVRPTTPIPGTGHPLSGAPYMQWKDFKKLGLGLMRNPTGSQIEDGVVSELKGVVVHPLRWLSLFYNESTSAFAAEFTRYRLDGTNAPIDDGSGKDYGVAFSLPDGKLSLRINYYETTRVGGVSPTYRGSSGPAIPKSIRDTIYHVEKTYWNANPNVAVDANSPTAFYQQTTKDSSYTSVTASTSFSRTGTPTNTPNRDDWDVMSNRFSEGVEVTLTANPIRGLSLSLRASESKTVESAVGADWFTLADERWATWETLSKNNVVMHNVPGQPTTVRAFFSDIILPSLSYIQQVDSLPNPQERKYRVNFTARYAFQEGRLKNFYFGGNYGWRSKSALGFFERPATKEDVFREFDGLGAGSFTVPDFSQPINGTELVTLDGFAGYRRKFNKGKYEWVVQLNVRNLLDEDGFIPQRAYGFNNNGVNDYRYTNYNLPEPRRFILTNTFSF